MRSGSLHGLTPAEQKGFPDRFLSSVVFPGLAVPAINVISKWMHLSLQMLVY